MENSKIDEIKIELGKIYKEFHDFQSTIDKLLHHLEKVDPTFSTTTRGTLISAGANAEIILKYIIKKEGLTIIKNQGRGRNEDNPNKPATLNDFIYTLRNILPLEVKNHLGTIQDWRNLSAHGNSVDKIDDSTLESVSASMKYFVRWFFEGYLKGEYKDYTFDISSKKLRPEDVKPEPQNQPLEKPSASDGLVRNFGEQVRKRIAKRILFGLLIASGLITCIYSFYHVQAETQNSPDPKSAKSELGKEDVYRLLIRYYSSQNDLNSDAYDYFSRKVYQYYLYKNLNPTKVDIIRKTEVDYIDKKNAIDKESLSLFLRTDSVIYWRFWNNFGCYRTTKKKFETCKVLTEFGFDNSGKIASIKEIEVRGLRYSKKKPY